MKKPDLKILLSLISLFVLSACEEPSKELLAKRYTREELASQICVQEKQCAETEERVWFIDEKFIFSYDLKTWTKRYEDGARVEQVLNYNGLAVGLVEGGAVYIAAHKENGGTVWQDIARHSMKSIEVAGDDLIGLDTDGSIYRYLGTPGGIHWDYMTFYMSIPMSCGQNCTMNIQMPYMVPYANGREVAFEETNMKDVAEIFREDGTVYIRKQTGEIVFYTRDSGTETLATKP